MPVDAGSGSVQNALLRLLRRIHNNKELFATKYSRSKTIQEYGPNAGRFKMCRLHRGKISIPLLDYLKNDFGDDPLAWLSNGADDWLILHPLLGSAILSLVAINVAFDLGLAIVTDSTGIHQTLISHDETTVVDALLGESRRVEPSGVDDTVDELAEVVITTAFDVSHFSAQQIADLLRDGKGLEKFKDALAPIASSHSKDD